MVNWKQIAEDDLRKYESIRAAVENNRQQIELLEDELHCVKAIPVEAGAHTGWIVKNVWRWNISTSTADVMQRTACVKHCAWNARRHTRSADRRCINISCAPMVWYSAEKTRTKFIDKGAILILDNLTLRQRTDTSWRLMCPFFVIRS